MQKRPPPDIRTLAPVGRATEVKGISRKLGGGKKEAIQKQCMDEVLGLSRYFDSNIY